MSRLPILRRWAAFVCTTLIVGVLPTAARAQNGAAGRTLDATNAALNAPTEPGVVQRAPLATTRRRSWRSSERWTRCTIAMLSNL